MSEPLSAAELKTLAQIAFDKGDNARARQLISQMKSLGPVAPEGTTIVETFENGGRIVRNNETGTESYVSASRATSDPKVIAEMRASGGDADSVLKRGDAQSIIDQTGELAARGASLLKSVPFIGSYADEAVGMMFGDDAKTAMRAAQEAREIVAPKTVMASRAAGGLATGLAAAAAAPAVALAPLAVSYTHLTLPTN